MVLGLHQTLKKKTFKFITLLRRFFIQKGPLIETIIIKKKNKSYEVPMYVSEKRSLSIVLKWFTKAIKKRTSKFLSTKISKELKDVIQNKGSIAKETKKLRKRIANNVMFSHYRWR